VESNEQNGKLRAVIAIDEGRDISQAADMQKLKRVYRDMTDCEQERTRDYLNQQNEKENE